MVNPFFSKFGAWKPFTKGLPPPLVNPSDEPWLILKFNEAWRPYITGALTSLARPESYEDVLPEFIREDIDFGSQLPWLIEPFTVVQFYNWQWIQKPGDNGDTPSIVQQILVAPGIDGSFGTQFYVSHNCANCEDATQLTAVGQQGESPFSYPVGGHVTSLFGFLTHTVIGNVFSVRLVDCLGNETVQTFGGQSFEITDISIKEFEVDALGAFIVSVQMDENWTCGPA